MNALRRHNVAGAMKPSTRGENIKRRMSLVAKSNWEGFLDEVAPGGGG